MSRSRIRLAGAMPILAAMFSACFIAPVSADAPPSQKWPATGDTFRVLQMNLCNETEKCDSKSIKEAQRLIHEKKADIATLNDTCESHLKAYGATMTDTHQTDWTAWSFMPAWDGSTLQERKCKDGSKLGIAILGHVPQKSWHQISWYGGIYNTQEPGSKEEGSWLCMVAKENYTACTTQLHPDKKVAVAQCEAFADKHLPSVWKKDSALRTVVGGTLGLPEEGKPNADDCLRDGWFRKGDGGAQHTMAANSEFTFASSEAIEMKTTDQPAWLVELTAK